ncbi:Prostaglandin F synthase [Hondaea fermentalgiana]|uniref:Prostaglandin F synthase n=1 Tax=Hondaea fermentalgiana TaxID=2315210 RepID=A0A2R5GK06_9STRA|nr:Prostaglandin F synthase [Hondaea fermentalgiana]|eukprot:GBG28194.1 Prostaglandin F synthase [Hondaea fermentalgiana]
MTSAKWTLATLLVAAQLATLRVSLAENVVGRLAPDLGDEADEAVAARHGAGSDEYFDGAEATEWYDDEALGRTIVAYLQENPTRLGREELFLTSKVHPKNLGHERTLAAVKKMLERFQTEYLDLVLLHYPRCGDWIPDCQGVSPEGDWLDSYAALEDLYNAGQIRAIGLSNQHKIAYTSYSTLGGQWEHRAPYRRNLVSSNDVIGEIAAQTGKSVQAVTLLWALQRDVIVIPRSTSPEHIRANAAVSEESFLSEADLAQIDALAM